MIDVTFTIEGTDFSDSLSTYEVLHEITYSEIITTMDGAEHYGKQFDRSIINFSLMPLTDEQTNDLYSALRGPVYVVFTDPDAGVDMSATMRLDGNLSSVFALRSVDGNRYYKGRVITLRALSAR